MKIGNVDIPHGLALAPMAGVTDHSFRSICREFGAEYTVSEMISAKAVYYKDKKTDELARIYQDEYPCAIQIFGHEFDIMAYAAAKLCEKYHPQIIDVNMGCPMHKIVSNGEGSALMKDADNVRKIVKGIYNEIDIPLTVKIRAGWNEDSKNAVEIAKICEDNGASAICVHGRTKEQLYSPPVDLDIIAEVKQAVKIPVFGNGGIYTASDAVNMFNYTGCDGIMIARGCLGNPFLFNEIKCSLTGEKYIKPTFEEKLSVAIRHAQNMISEKGTHGVLEARKLLSWYICDVNGAAEARGKINRAESESEMLDILYELKEKQKSVKE